MHPLRPMIRWRLDPGVSSPTKQVPIDQRRVKEGCFIILVIQSWRIVSLAAWLVLLTTPSLLWSLFRFAAECRCSRHTDSYKCSNNGGGDFTRRCATTHFASPYARHSVSFAEATYTALVNQRQL